MQAQLFKKDMIKNGRSSSSNTPTPHHKTGTVNLHRGSYGLPKNGIPNTIQLHLNENLFLAAQTPKEQIADLAARHLTNLHAYPTAGTQLLQQAIAAKYGINPDKIVITNGSSELLRSLVLYLCQQDDTILLPAPGWSFYKAIANLINANIETFSLRKVENGFIYEKQQIINAIEATNPKAVLICSPNNPTGSVMPIADLFSLVQTYPHVNFILDEAYYGFSDHYTARDEKRLLKLTDQGNLYVTRSFSKSYGLANLRIGFVITNEQCGRALTQLAPTFGIPTFSQALAAQRIADSEFAKQLKAEYALVNDYMQSTLTKIPGLAPFATAANFILCRHDSRWHQLEKMLLQHGYMIKRETILGANNYFRITYADIETMQHLVSLIERYI
ncbi:MAG: histidinol-phosphate transaminase [Chloroflexota bacterium]